MIFVETLENKIDYQLKNGIIIINIKNCLNSHEYVANFLLKIFKRGFLVKIRQLKNILSGLRYLWDKEVHFSYK